jgi:uncharacterized protein (UPF0276 family)
MAIENISWYTRVGETQLDETAFISLILEEAECGMLLDVNNVFVNATNHGFDAKAWIDRIDPSRVWQLHVAGHEWRPSEELIIDTHGAPVVDPVWQLLGHAFNRFGVFPTLLERDENIPALPEVLSEIAIIAALQLGHGHRAPQGHRRV